MTNRNIAQYRRKKSVILLSNGTSKNEEENSSAKVIWLRYSYSKRRYGT